MIVLPLIFLSGGKIWDTTYIPTHQNGNDLRKSTPNFEKCIWRLAYIAKCQTEIYSWLWHWFMNKLFIFYTSLQALRRKNGLIFLIWLASDGLYSGPEKTGVNQNRPRGLLKMKQQKANRKSSVDKKNDPRHFRKLTTIFI